MKAMPSPRNFNSLSSSWKLALLLIITIGLKSTAKETPHEKSGKLQAAHVQKLASACNSATAQTDLDINNVRTTLLVGGDMWWNLKDPKYEIPKGSGAHSIFAGSLWFGGIDAGGQLKVAAQTYHQSGVDMWSGPLDTANVSVESDVCEAFDKH